MACGLSCSTARGIFLDQGSNLCILHWQVDSLPLSHQGRPLSYPLSVKWAQIMGTMSLPREEVETWWVGSKVTELIYLPDVAQGEHGRRIVLVAQSCPTLRP